MAEMLSQSRKMEAVGRLAGGVVPSPIGFVPFSRIGLLILKDLLASLLLGGGRYPSPAGGSETILRVEGEEAVRSMARQISRRPRISRAGGRFRRRSRALVRKA